MARFSTTPSPADELDALMENQNTRCNNHRKGIFLTVNWYIDKKKDDADRVRNGEDPLYTDEDWSEADEYLQNVLEGKYGLNNLAALVATAMGPQEARPLPEPELEDEGEE